MYGAQLTAALRERTGAHFFGMGGPHMARAGVELVANSHEVAVVGLAEALHKIPSVIRVQRRLTSEAARCRPALAILIDSPSTHMGVARRLQRIQIPVGYFIGPQIWAWRAGRIHTIKRLVKKMVVIFPFEEKIYRDAGVDVEFVGHPLVDIVRSTMGRGEFAKQHGLDASRPIIALLPGSRKTEIAHNFPRILEACEQVSREMAESGIQFVHVAASGLGSDLFSQYERPGLSVKRTEGAVYDALAAADCAIVASGTATVEAALLGTPMVVVYRLAPASAFFLRFMIQTPFISMVNLIAERRIVPELIQDNFTSASVAAETRKLLESSAAREEMRADLAHVKTRLGPGGAIGRTAEAFARML
jgi:lipid-A-disaccharide synthase